MSWQDFLPGVLLLAVLATGLWLSRRVPWFRRIFFRGIRLILLPAMAMSRLLGILDRWRRSPRWVIGGHCHMCGRCCELLAMRMPPYIAERDWLRDAVRWYYEENYGFVFEGIREGIWLVFSCSSLGADGRCTIYARRPRVCREYPSAWEPDPPDIPDYCGFVCHGPYGSPSPDGPEDDPSRPSPAD